ncbi:MAG: hypothetical protein GXC73_12205 [Chitinophagaceae bacterium]|nr:hypothetical protein [Chitinophagaceae bacterium]
MKHLIPLVCILCISFFSSCLKAKCTGNCITTTFRGRIYDATTNRGFDKIKVRAIWSNQSQSYLYPEVAIVKTNGDGWFEMNVKINPDDFNSKSLNIQFEAPNGFELRGNLDGNHFYSDKSFYDYDPVTFQQIDFKLYPVTTAKIQLIRTQTDAMKQFNLSYNFNNEYPTNFGYQFNNFNLNYEYTIITTADIYTRITLEKTSMTGSKIIISDSAIFRRNQTNNLQINY